MHAVDIGDFIHLIVGSLDQNARDKSPAADQACIFPVTIPLRAKYLATNTGRLVIFDQY
jgi:hypothetical protein